MPFAEDEKAATHIALNQPRFGTFAFATSLKRPIRWRGGCANSRLILYHRYVAFSQQYFLIMLHVHNVVRHRVMQTLRRVTIL
jgi:hypothetical protein